MSRIILFVLKKQKLILLAFSFILCLWGMFYPNPYRIIIWALIFFPIIRVLFLFFENGKFQIRNIEYDKEVIHWSIVFPALALGLRSVLDFKIVDFSNGYVPVIILIIIFLSIYFITIKKELVLFKKENSWLNLYAVLFIVVYSFCIVTSTNVVLDKNSLQKSEVEVLSKRISRGGKGGPFYYLILGHNNKKINEEEIPVSKVRYNEIDIGDTLSILIGTGKYNIPWFILNENN